MCPSLSEANPSAALRFVDAVEAAIGLMFGGLQGRV